MALLSVGPSLSDRDASLDLPLAGFVPFSNFTDSSASSPRDFEDEDHRDDRRMHGDTARQTYGTDPYAGSYESYDTSLYSPRH